MFKVSEEIYLGASDSANHSKTYGVYNKSADDDSYGKSLPVFVSPDVTEVNKVQVLHWPEGNIFQGKPLEFFVRKNGARGNVQVKLVNIKNQSEDLPLQALDPDRYLCRFVPENLGVQKIRIYFNTVEIPSSPFPLYVRADDTLLTKSAAATTNLLPIFQSNALNVRCHGPGINKISLQQRNEFVVDASRGGNNILFVAILGPNGQCDNLAIRHLGDNIYNVTYAVTVKGQYTIIVKWGEESIPGSPFQLMAQ